MQTHIVTISLYTNKKIYYTYYLYMELGVFNHQNYSLQSRVNFKRKLKEDEKPKYEADMNKAFDYLGIKNRALIIHGSVYPDTKNGAKNVHNDSLMIKNHYIGTPYRQREFNKIAKMHGFNCIQLGPNGELCRGDNSPYRASIYAKNPLFIDYGEMITNDYANILSKKEIDEINTKPKSSNKNYEMSDFDEAKEISKILMHKAFKNFSTKLAQNDINAQKLNNEFNNFKKENSNWIEPYAVAHVLSDIHGTDNFHTWDNPIDKHLFSLKKAGNKSAEERYNTIKTRSKDNIEEYMFTQFIADKQEKADKIERAKDGIKYIGDLLVGFSYADELVHEDAFTPGWKIGAEYGGPCNSPQIWNNPLPNPKKLFNEDGTLGESGKLLYNKVKKASENVENIRVDNVMGLVDPYVYKADTVHKIIATDNSGTYNIADRNQLVGGNLSSQTEVDPEGNFKKILHNIVIPAMKESGINPKEAVWENLGEQSKIFKQVFEHEEKLPGIILSTGARTQDLCFDWAPVRDKDGQICKNEKGEEIWEQTVSKPDWSLIGSHDNIPTFKYLDQSWIYDPENNGSNGWMPEYLGGYLCPDPDKANERNRLTDNIRHNPELRLKAKYAELMRGTQNIQVTFSDMFAIDKVYNPRNNSSDTWKVRLTEDYNDKYHQNLITEEEPVMNMPEILGMAVKAKAGMMVAKNIESKDESYAKANPIINNLKHWENVLKSPEE